MFDEADCCGNGCANCVLDQRKEATATATAVTDLRNFVAVYRKFKLVNKRPHSSILRENEVLELHFSACDVSGVDDAILSVPPGHHLMMRIVSDVNGIKKKHLRPYSPFWINRTKRFEFKILVNLKPCGIMSNYFAKLTTEESRWPEFRLHNGTYKHEHIPAKCLVIISQGVAIAPTIPIIEQVMQNKDDMSRIIHLACFQDLEHFYFRDQLRDYNQNWNYSSYTFLAHQKCDLGSCQQAGKCSIECSKFLKSLKYKEQVLPQRLRNVDIIEAIVKRPNKNDKLVFVLSGSRKFQDNMKVIVENLDLPLNNIYLL